MTLWDQPLLFWLLMCALALLAGYVQGFTGFGFAVVFTPLSAFLGANPHDVVLLSLFQGAVLSILIFVETYRSIQVKKAWLLWVSAALGTPLGIAVWYLLDPRQLRLFIAAGALTTASLWLLHSPPPIRREQEALAVAGFLGGFLNGSTSMGGPPPALLVSIQRWPAQESRGALVTFNLLSYLVGLATALLPKLAGATVLVQGTWLLPFAFAGSLPGSWSVHRVSKSAFTYALTATVWLAGLLGLVSALMPRAR